MANKEIIDQEQFALAEVSISTDEHGNQTDNHAGETAAAETREGEAHGEADGFQFSQLFDHLANHYGIVWGPVHIDMPMIFYDSKEGFNFYSSPQAMEEAGVYTMHHHQAVKADTHEPPTIDMSVTSLVVYQWLAMLLLFFAFARIGGKYKKQEKKAPSGFQNMLESIFIYVRDEMVLPNVGTKKLAHSLLPYFVSLFFFILVVNLLGLIPGAHTATGAIGTCTGLAITAFIVINITSIKEIGLINYLKHLLGGAPWWMAPIMIPIEILSMFIKPFALTIRLFANMTAGHVVLLSLVGLIFYFETAAISVISTPFSIFVLFLETFVGFLQAYIFTVLTAIFVGLALGGHAEDHELAHGAH